MNVRGTAIVRLIASALAMSASLAGCSTASTTSTTTTTPTTLPAPTTTTVESGQPGQAVPTLHLGDSFVIHTSAQEAKVALLQVIDPIMTSQTFGKVPAGTRTVGLRLSVDNLGPASIVGTGERHLSYLVVEAYATDKRTLSGFGAKSPECASYPPIKDMTVGESYSGCEFVALPTGVRVAKVVVVLVYGGLGGNAAVWQVP